MGKIKDARRVLLDAEASLRQLMEVGLKEQRYSDVAEVASLADGLSRLLNAAPASTLVEPPPQAPARSVVDAGANAPTSAPRKTKSEYPRFERDGDKLVKIGWSKKSKTSYEHRAPQEAVIAFARHLQGSVPEGKVFAVEKLLPVPDVASGSEVPAYQVYLTLAWLRHVGIIEKKGRDGYVLRAGALADGALDQLWQSVPVRKS